MLNSQDDLRLLLEHVGDGLTAEDRSGRIVFANTAAAHILGCANPAELLNAPLPEILNRFALFDDSGHPLPTECLPGRRAIEGEASPTMTVRHRVRGSKEERWATVRAAPVHDHSGTVRCAVNVWHDITNEKRAEFSLRYLAEAGEVLGASLDVEETLGNITSLAVPRLADWCAVHLVNADGSVSQVAVAHRVPAKVTWARKLQERYPVDPDSEYGVAQAIRTGEPQIIPEITDAMVAAAAQDEEHLDILAHLGLTSAIISPMMTRERTLGAITFVSAESGYRYGEEDLALLEELARRAALALENASLYKAEHAARLTAEESQTRFRALFEGVPDSILVINANGELTDANKSACDLLHYDFNELLTLHSRDLSTDSGPATVESLLCGQTHERVECDIRRKDGALIPVEVWSRRLTLGSGLINICVLHDLSERRAAEKIREEERLHLAQELHDSVSQAVFTLSLYGEAASRLLASGDVRTTAEYLDEIGTTAHEALQEMRLLVFGLLPPILAQDGLVAALRARLESIEGRAGLRTTLKSGGLQRLSPRLEEALYRISQEALNNVIKHSKATSVTISLEQLPHTIQLQIIDDGIGFNTEASPNSGGMGLRSMITRCEGLGGELSIESSPGRGTRVQMEVPQ